MVVVFVGIDLSMRKSKCECKCTTFVMLNLNVKPFLLSANGNATFFLRQIFRCSS